MSETDADPAGAGASAAAVIRVVLVVDLDRFPDVVAAARQAGLVVDDEWPETGTLTGRLKASLMPALQSIDGVVAVEPERSFQLPPPRSDPQ